jgi:hypothetical protein
MNKSSGMKNGKKSLCASSMKFSKPFTPTYALDTSANTMESTDVTHSSIATESLVQQTYSVPLVEHLDLSTFKLKPCPIPNQHNHKHCQFYHNQKDRKRPGNFYSSDLCEYAEKENVTCPKGDNCPKAHNRVEQLYKQDKYKTKFCTYFPNNVQACDYGTFCSFAHSEYDIVIELIHNYDYDDDFYLFHFKTIWCPFNLTQHDKALCVYAHNWQDYRRKPHTHTYDPIPCPNWKSTDFIVNYEDGCPLKEKCTKCHGWKENEYHPNNYKNKPCSMGKNCQKGKDCPHFHNPKERRNANGNIASRMFKQVPRNRIISNTFKVRAEDKMPTYMGSNNQYSNQTYIGQYPAYVMEGKYCYNTDAIDTTPSKPTSLMSIFSCMSPHPLNQLEEERKESYAREIYGRKSSYDGTDISECRSIMGSPPGIPGENSKRKWSACEPMRARAISFESERMFKELIQPSMAIPDSMKSNALFGTDYDEIDYTVDPKDEYLEKKYHNSNADNNDEEMKQNLMLDKILENEDM